MLCKYGGLKSNKIGKLLSEKTFSIKMKSEGNLLGIDSVLTTTNRKVTIFEDGSPLGEIGLSKLQFLSTETPEESFWVQSICDKTDSAIFVFGKNISNDESIVVNATLLDNEYRPLPPIFTNDPNNSGGEYVVKKFFKPLFETNFPDNDFFYILYGTEDTSSKTRQQFFKNGKLVKERVFDGNLYTTNRIIEMVKDFLEIH